MLAPPFVEGFFLDLPIDTKITVYAVLPDSAKFHYFGIFVVILYWATF